MTNSLSKEIAKFVYNLNYDNIDSNTIAKAKLAFLDYLAVTLRGFSSKSSQIVIKTFNDIGNISTLNQDNSHKSSIIGHNNVTGKNSVLKSDILTASFINGISAHALDLDDGHSLAKLHIGSVVFSAALSVAEAYNSNGKSFLEAVIGAYDVAISIGMAINPQHRNQGFHTTGTVGAIASAVVSSKLLGLGKNQIISAIGLAGTNSSGILESNHSGVMGKHLHVANAVRNGINAALLAKNGFTGSPSIIDGNQGIMSAMVNDANFDTNSLNQDIIFNMGNFSINDIYVKKYPVCRHLHSSIDATLAILDNINKDKQTSNNINKNNIHTIIKDNKDNTIIDSSNINNLNIAKVNNLNVANYIKSININTYKIACEHNNYYPTSLEDLRQSLPYAVAISIVFGDLTEDIISNYFDNYIQVSNATTTTTTTTNTTNTTSTTDNEFNINLNNSNSNDNTVNDIDNVYNVINLANKISINLNADFENIGENIRPSTVEITLANNINDYYSENNINNINNIDSINYANTNNYRDLCLSKTVNVPSGEGENPLLLEDILDKFKSLNSDFDISNLDLINNIELYKINDFLKNIL